MNWDDVQGCGALSEKGMQILTNGRLKPIHAVCVQLQGRLPTKAKTYFHRECVCVYACL